MNERTLRVLEFGKIKERLLTYASSSLGREEVENLEIMTDDIDVVRSLQETTEARAICRLEEFPLRGLTDIRSSLRRAIVGAVVPPEELLAVASVCSCSRRVYRFFRDKSDSYPLLGEYGVGLTSMRDLEDSIERAINEFGEVKDSASSKLGKLRQDIRSMQSRIKARLDSMVRSTTVQKYLQENIVTLRNDRYVLPVKQEYRGQVPGIIHDQSASGATLFIEPMVVVEINNDLRRVLVEEEHEVERILRELSAEVATHADSLQVNLRILTHLDLVMAKGKFSYDLRGVQPLVNTEGYVHLRSARHPLLPPNEVVPSTIYLGKEFNVLLVTGPNTGGKTVTLKTVGLLSLMAQAGLHVPADEGSEVSIFESIYADIGDEQSIEQSLSTFSSHMTNIIDITKRANRRSLVLLDELGAGTDPAEGAALAMAIIDHLQSLGCRLVATTHYSELKSYAYQTPGVQNASVEFDVNTLRPTYRLLIGLPGKSNAFEIAQRLGLSSQLIDDSRRYLSGEQLRVEDLIKQLENSRREAESERDQARQLRRQAEEKANELERSLREQKRDQAKIIGQSKQEAKSLVYRYRQQLDQLMADLRALIEKAETSSVKELNQQMELARQSFRSLQKEAAEAAPEEKIDSSPRIAGDRDFQTGDRVLVRHLGQQGQLLSEPTPSGEVQVQLGSLRLSCKVEQLEKLVPEKPKAAMPTIQIVNVARSGVPMELDLRGQTVDDSIMRVDKYLDDANVAGMSSVHIIHGKGTGALRNAVRDYLKSHPVVKTFRFGGPAEGGTGVTVIELKK